MFPLNLVKPRRIGEKVVHFNSVWIVTEINGPETITIVDVSDGETKTVNLKEVITHWEEQK